MNFSVKVVDQAGEISWLISNNRYNFTKSKAEFILQSAVKRGLYPFCSLEVVANA